MPLTDVQSLVLRKAPPDSVAHLMMRVDKDGGAALSQLKWFLDQQPLSIGTDSTAAVRCTLGLSYRGLEALCVPPEYLGVFSRLAPAFAAGAPLRGARLGDSGASAAANWLDEFGLDNAHVLLTLHGPAREVDAAVDRARKAWNLASGLVIVKVLRGYRLGHPAGEDGEWVHFGYRDGVSDHHVAGVPNPPARSIPHAPGEFLLGHANDSGFNPFFMSLAPKEVRDFFADSSFGVLRAMRQEVALFERAVEAWQQLAIGQGIAGATVQWVKAKLCGRWPSGERLRPGQLAPKPGDNELDFSQDPEGTGCPWAAHVRRMNPQLQGDAHQRNRPLIRRGTPFGLKNWSGYDDKLERGLYGFFFCASLEDQFEHLLGQWANRTPLGSPDDSSANDPIGGQHEFEDAVMKLPVPAHGKALEFTGFKPWTQTLGTLYAWHPSGPALARILDQKYVKPEDEGPWL